MNKFKNVPAVTTFLSGFITSVFLIVNQYSLVPFLWTLVVVMIGFYLVGRLIKFGLNKVNKDIEDLDIQEDEDDGSEEFEEPLGLDDINIEDDSRNSGGNSFL